MNVTTALGMCVPKQSIPWHFEHEWACAKTARKQSIPQHFEHERYHSFGHV